jgi:transcriptional regulator with XRE-family HTH domain
MSLQKRQEKIKDLNEMMSGEEIRSLRIQLRWSQHRLAKECGISRNRISLYECSYYPIKYEELSHIIKILTENLKKGNICHWGRPFDSKVTAKIAEETK